MYLRWLIKMSKKIQELSFFGNLLPTFELKKNAEYNIAGSTKFFIFQELYFIEAVPGQSAEIGHPQGTSFRL